MPPSHVKTIRELIYWEYAKLISEAAVGSRKNYGFITHTYKKLKSGQMNPSDILRENQMLVKGDNACAYCDADNDNFHWEHIIPKSRGGPDTIDNMVLACPGCNLSKGAKDPFEWYGNDRKYEIPRIVLGKYLKLVFDAHAAKDSGIALKLGEDAGLKLPVAKSTWKQYAKMKTLGLGDLDKSGIAELTFKGRTLHS